MPVQLMLVYITVCLALTIWLCLRWKRRKLYAAAATMDGPPCLPFLGHAYLIFGKRTGEYIIQVFDRYAPKYKSPIAIWMGPKLIVAFKDNPDYFQTVMNSPHLLNKMDQYNFFRAENGLLTAPENVWKTERKLLNRSFSPLMLSSFVDKFNEKDFTLVENLRKFVGKGEVNVQIYIAKCTIDALFGKFCLDKRWRKNLSITCLSTGNAFGKDLNTQGHDGADEYLRCLDTFLSLVFKRVLHVERYLEGIYRLTTDYQIETNCVNIIRNMSLDLMKEVKENSKDSRSVTEQEAAYEGKPALNFADSLSKLAKHNPSLTEDHIKDHIDTMIMAGHDTTATTISNMLLMLAMHPEVQELVYQEVMCVCPDSSSPVTTEEANSLVYTEMVCKETMRLFPVAPVIGRKCVADVKLDDKHTIPAGCCVALGIYQIHRDPSIWGLEADKFNPDHFLPERVAERHPYAYLPFSGGPRNCIGIRYAWLSMKIMIAHLVRNYRFKTSLKMEDLVLKFAIVLRITNGCLLTIEDR
ncbi:cytochrome P450 4C1-like isoform X1 [Anopheles stephensi]|uniref:cytochrome P450 4C1-like isoform X1 n=1 Tax=Anopheles stephensi TaxID=30069 RepID=UPI001658B3D4|nr:cytochrome P450 4C1-like isoform X1 [Anopheles stephensi]